MAIKAYRIPLVPATASGTTALSDPITAGGWLEALRLVRPSTGQITTVAKITITDQLTGQTVFDATATSTGSQSWYPRAALYDVNAGPVGFTSDPGSASSPRLYDKFPLAANSRFRVVVASGGANTSGVLWAYLSGA